MRRTLGLVALLLIASLPAWAADNDVRISEMYSNPDGDREFIELWNAGGSPVELQGWQIQDAAGNTYTFDAWQLGPDERVVVWGGGAPDARGPAWSKATVWNNGGDIARLVHNGQLVDEVTFGELERGTSWAFDGTWKISEPSPGVAPGSHSYGASATVSQVPPSPSLDVPETARPGVPVSLQVHVQDDNGDPFTWELWQGDELLARNATGAARVNVTAPSSGDWPLHLHAVDAYGNEAWANRTVSIIANPLSVTLPDGGVVFPSMRPGQVNVTSNAFTITNRAGEAIIPRIDVSDFVGPTSWTVDGNLRMLVDGQIVPYDGPLTALPALAPGASLDVALQLDAPRPLPAGDYGTSFTVMA